MKLVGFHLFNDYSGSPKVLKMVLEGLSKRGYDIDIISSKGGVLDELTSERVRHIHYRYKYSMNPLVTTFRYSWVQFHTFWRAFRYLFQKESIFYINTILPVGPALAGKLMGKRVVYHYHEDAQAKSGLYRFLAHVMCRIATEIICVSDYQRSFVARKERVYVVPNALPEAFAQRLVFDKESAFARQTVLLVASLKKYKGIMQFMELASRLPQYKFVAVVNDEAATIDSFLKEEGITLSDNLTIYPRQEDVASFYQQSSILLNLSDPTQFVETFGLTVLEAMSAGLPVIVPTKGGVAEMVTDGENGYKIDVSQLEEIARRISEILGDSALYDRVATAAYKKSKEYSEEKIIAMISSIISGK